MAFWIDTARLADAQALFGLPPLDRHLRALARRPAGTRVVLSGPAAGAMRPEKLAIDVATDTAPFAERLRAALAASAEPTLVVLDGGSLVDPRLLDMLAEPGPALVARGGDGDERAAALRLPTTDPDIVPDGVDGVADLADRLLADGVAAELTADAFPGFVTKLRRHVDFYVVAVPDAARREARERWLFWSNYKGSTDLLTRWVYPPLVWPLVRFCTAFRIHPNGVTMLSILLTVAAVPLFAMGQFWSGLALAYAMSVLDSVDGKVARLTLTDSRLGDVLDHGLDIVHPPFWYLAWAWGLAGGDPASPLMLAGWWLTAFYIGDRLALMVAKWRFGRGLHAMTPLDGAVRGIIARRNINLLIFTAGLAAGAPETGFHAVVVWQGVTMLWHIWRTAWVA